MENNWIKVSEKLPELTERLTWWNDKKGEREPFGKPCKITVLAYNKEIGVFKAEFDGRRWCEISSNSVNGTDRATPTHWMFLPDKPNN